jgi:hypothetical protein
MGDGRWWEIGSWYCVPTYLVDGKDELNASHVILQSVSESTLHLYLGQPMEISLCPFPKGFQQTFQDLQPTSSEIRMTPPES